MDLRLMRLDRQRARRFRVKARAITHEISARKIEAWLQGGDKSRNEQACRSGWESCWAYEIKRSPHTPNELQF